MVCALGVAGAVWLMASDAAQATPRVVVTVKPVHALAAGVMRGAGKPSLLLPGGATPHTYALKPSAARMLARADLVVRVGPTLEAFLDRPLATLARRARVVTLIENAGLDLIRTPESHDETDPHVWLDPANARRIATHMASVLSELDPDNANRYQVNLLGVQARIDALDKSLHAVLAPVRARPFVVFHDGYGYFERAYGLNRVAAVTLAPERAPGARRLREIRGIIRNAGAICVFAEPQFRPALITTLARGTSARIATLDPLGAAIPPGTEAYFTLMRALAASLRRCLAAG